MKRSLLILFIASATLFSCRSSRSFLRSGQYDRAIDKSVKKLRRNSTNQKEILVLEEAYNKAMDADSMKILFMKKEGRPDLWDEIFTVYSGMKARQDKVRPLPMLRITDKKFNTLRVVDFRFRDFDNEIIQSKQKAAEYDYTHAMSLMDKGGRQNGREAFYDLQKVKQLIPDFRDVDIQMNKAAAMGTSYVLLKVKNETRTVIPMDLEEDLMKISPGGMNEQWIKYFTSEAQGIHYDFFVLVKLEYIDVSPESIKESQFTESRDVQDGWQYVKDLRGNVMKDSLGNDIKVPRIVNISCTVMETFQHKTARITGSLDFVNAHNNTLLQSFPIMADAKFENQCAVPMGDVEALKPESKQHLGGSPRPFPNDLDMIYRAGVNLKEMSKGIVKNNEDVLK